jgi:hypothetical protein
LLLSDSFFAICFMYFVFCYVLVNCFVFLNYLCYVCFLILYVCFLFCVICVFYCFVYYFSPCTNTPVCFIFVYKFTYHCHRVETQLQLINIIYHVLSYYISYIISYIIPYHSIYHIISYRISYHITSYIIISYHIIS